MENQSLQRKSTLSKEFTETDGSNSFSSDEEENKIHPLSPKWVLWLWIGDRNKEWSQCLEQQCVMISIEDFIALKHRILPPSKLPTQEINYYVFKEGIKPMWEDPCNQGGGTIDMVIGRQYQHTRLDRLWFELLMTALGGQFFEHNNKICGASVLIRTRGFTISLWITDVTSVKAYGPILEIIEAKLGIANDAAVNIQVKKHPVQWKQMANGDTGENEE